MLNMRTFQCLDAVLSAQEKEETGDGEKDEPGCTSSCS